MKGSSVQFALIMVHLDFIKRIKDLTCIWFDPAILYHISHTGHDSVAVNILTHQPHRSSFNDERGNDRRKGAVRISVFLVFQLDTVIPPVAVDGKGLRRVYNSNILNVMLSADICSLYSEHCGTIKSGPYGG